MKFRNTDPDLYAAFSALPAPKLPESLLPDEIARQVCGQPQARRKPQTPQVLAAVLLLFAVGIAACVLLLRAPRIQPPIPSEQAPVAEVSDAHLHTAHSYAEIEAYFAAMQDEWKKSEQAAPFLDRVAGILSGEKSEKQEPPTNTDQIGDAPFGTTNVQVEGIAEADILQNDGAYLYIVRSTENSCVEILDVRRQSQITRTATVSLADAVGTDTAQILEIYVQNDRLTVLAAAQDSPVPRKFFTADSASAPRTFAAVYDITSRSDPKHIDTYAVDGRYISSRLDGSRLILLTDYAVSLAVGAADLQNACVPCYYQNGKKIRFPAAAVQLPDRPAETTYLTVSVLDLQTPAAAPALKAVLGCAETLFCDGKNLLAANSVYPAPEESAAGDRPYTRLYAFSLQNGIVYNGSADIDGIPHNSFSIDAHNGYYRLATTAQDGCRITVLDQSLQTVGTLGGLAAGEEIQAVRFFGDTAYLVTFRQTDPLFTIDLRNPAAPTLCSALQLTGFSDYLHPCKNGFLLGVGQDTTAQGAVDRVRVSLFDVRDPNAPIQADQFLFGTHKARTVSAAQHDHKAFLCLSDDTFAIPISAFGNTPKAYAAVLTVSEGRISIEAIYAPPDPQAEIRRITYIGDTLYTLSEQEVTAFSRSSGEICAVYTSTQTNAIP